MRAWVGIDVGAISVNTAIVIGPADLPELLARESIASAFASVDVPADSAHRVLVGPYRRTRGRPVDTAREALCDILRRFGTEHVERVAMTGSGSDLVAARFELPRCNEFQACARAADLLHPEARTIFEMGGETSRFLRLAPDPRSRRLSILDYSTNGDCAAGTGAFLDQQAARLQFAVEDIGDIAEQTQVAAQIAGRCSVFAKSDMIHAQQKGFKPPEVLRGLCNAVATNFKSAVIKGHAIVPPVALVGGVAHNRAVVRALREVFALTDQELFVARAADCFGAVGAALLAGERGALGTAARQALLASLAEDEAAAAQEFGTSPPLSLERVTLLRDRIRPYAFPDDNRQLDVYLGVDVGSVGTKLVLVDGAGEVVHWIFTRTEGRPIEVVSRCLHELEEAVGWRIRVAGVGTTGSGRELIGELIGADSINDEITAHKTGATFIGDRLLGKRPDTIFEIGGQDSKYIRLEPGGEGSTDTVVVDFTMNEACAAGTGSFLEERAEELGVAIKGEFAQLALSSRAPLKLGERCTVFMERDVNTCMQRGARREDVIAGLAYSVAYNYINRVVRGRPVGNCVFFQGGTAYNDAVAAAFSQVTGKEIIVPPHNAVLGAIGAALLAREKMQMAGGESRFRGFDLAEVDYTLREFTCKGCGNYCSVQEFNVEGEKTFWGDKCSDRYRKRAKTDRQPVIADLVALRRELLAVDDTGDPPGATRTVGVPLAMYTHDLLPLWRRFLRDCGFRVLLSDETNRTTVRQGLDCVVAEPCFPIIVAHGHVADLIQRNVDFLWLPNILSAFTPVQEREMHVCPWGQTLPFVIRQAPSFRSWQGRILCPTLRFQEGTEPVRRALVETVAALGVTRSVAKRAFDRGLEAQQHFRAAYQDAGRAALQTLLDTGEAGMILVGRPYNLHDPGVSISTARKLRDFYGVNVIPIDALALDDVDVSDVNDNMYWEYGRRILSAAKLVARHPNLHIIYITNFKCGPDSFIKGFIAPASGKPFLTLQFDGHANDAGMMTRCEAYLDSKGILRWWRPARSTSQASTAEPSTSLKWHTPVPG